MRLKKTIFPNSRFALVWGLVLLVLAAWLAMRVSSGPVLNANLMSLLPVAERDPVVDGVADRFREQFERRVLLLVGATDDDGAKMAAEVVRETLVATDQFNELTAWHGDDAFVQSGEFYFPLRFGLLSDTARQQIGDGDLKAFERSVLARYFNPISGLNSSLIEQDPLLLLPDFLEEKASANATAIVFEDGFLLMRADGKVFVLLSGTLDDSPFSFELQDRLAPVIESLKIRKSGQLADVTILAAGVFFHAVAGTARAKSEISRVGLGALAGVVLLFIAVFRSWRPLGLSLLAIAIGCLGGFVTCLALFGQVHLLTLVFGASLVGISVDYSLHYFCEHFRLHQNWSPQGALSHVLPGITLGLVTSVIGFAGLLLAPFPAMRQIAVFSGAGLVFAYICVLAIHPLFEKAIDTNHMTRPLRWSSVYIRFCGGQGSRWIWLVPASLFLVGALGISRLELQDDVRHLQSPDPVVLEEERRVRELIGGDFASQFFLVEGKDRAELLAREEGLTQALHRQQKAGRLSGYAALSDFVPSPARQAENRTLLEPLVKGDGNLLRRIARRIGLSHVAVDRYVNAFDRAPVPAGDNLSDWLAGPMATSYRYLWLGRSGDRVFSAVSLRGVKHPAELKQLAESAKGVTFVDNVGELSSIFGEVRRQAAWLTIASYAIVTLILLFRYGLRGGLAVMLGPVAAAFVGLGVQGIVGVPLSLFNVLALLLVLGIGVDYGIFFRETGTNGPATLVAIALSSISTVLAFGLLALSGTAAVHAFGLTVLVGIAVAFLLAPTAGAGRFEPMGKVSA